MNKSPAPRPLTPAHLRLAALLGREIAQDYLTAQTALERALQEQRTEHVPLLKPDKAA